MLPLQVDEGILRIKIEKVTNHFSIHYLKRRTFVCGLDVHKDSIYAALYNGKDRTDVQVFGTFTSQIKELSFEF